MVKAPFGFQEFLLHGNCGALRSKLKITIDQNTLKKARIKVLARAERARRSELRTLFGVQALKLSGLKLEAIGFVPS
jgi:hypothetical protein